MVVRDQDQELQKDQEGRGDESNSPPDDQKPLQKEELK